MDDPLEAARSSLADIIGAISSFNELFHSISPITTNKQQKYINNGITSDDISESKCFQIQHLSSYLSNFHSSTERIILLLTRAERIKTGSTPFQHPHQQHPHTSSESNEPNRDLLNENIILRSQLKEYERTISALKNILVDETNRAERLEKMLNRNEALLVDMTVDRDENRRTLSDQFSINCDLMNDLNQLNQLNQFNQLHQLHQPNIELERRAPKKCKRNYTMSNDEFYNDSNNESYYERNVEILGTIQESRESAAPIRRTCSPKESSPIGISSEKRSSPLLASNVILAVTSPASTLPSSSSSQSLSLSSSAPSSSSLSSNIFIPIQLPPVSITPLIIPPTTVTTKTIPCTATVSPSTSSASSTSPFATVKTENVGEGRNLLGAFIRKLSSVSTDVFHFGLVVSYAKPYFKVSARVMTYVMIAERILIRIRIIIFESVKY